MSSEKISAKSHEISFPNKFGLSLEILFQLTVDFYSRVFAISELPADLEIFLDACIRRVKFSESSMPQDDGSGMLNNFTLYRKEWQKLMKKSIPECQREFCEKLQNLNLPHYEDFIEAHLAVSSHMCDYTSNQGVLSQEKIIRLESIFHKYNDYCLSSLSQTKDPVYSSSKNPIQTSVTNEKSLELSENKISKYIDRDDNFERPKSDGQDDSEIFVSKLSPVELWKSHGTFEFIHRLKNHSANKIIVPAASASTLDVKSPDLVGSIISWSICIESHDISCSLFYITENPEIKLNKPVQSVDHKSEVGKTEENNLVKFTLFSKQFCKLSEFVLHGRHCSPGPGSYAFEFDNKYSLFRSKTVYFIINITIP